MRLCCRGTALCAACSTLRCHCLMLRHLKPQIGNLAAFPPPLVCRGDCVAPRADYRHRVSINKRSFVIFISQTARAISRLLACSLSSQPTDVQRMSNSRVQYHPGARLLVPVRDWFVRRRLRFLPRAALMPDVRRARSTYAKVS